MGAGAFGSALAIALASEARPVQLWGRDAAAMDEMARTRRVPRLPGVVLPENVQPVAALPEGLGTVLLAVPMQRLAEVCGTHRAALRGAALVACCKGLSLETGAGPTAALRDLDPHPALLTGPSFAADIARGLPTALTLACADRARGAALQAELAAPTLRLYRSTDVTGAELGGALKNVVAIGCGAVMGAGLGASARAALMTRGFAEMVRFATAQGARAETLAGLSGLGDLTLTCTSDLSRNYRLGQALGRGAEFDDATTVEGAATARALAARAAREGIEMPVTRAVLALLDGQLDVTEAMTALLARPAKEE
jgi:glycerol-3-phosphate dehydrogenase (NAD(P)+)